MHLPHAFNARGLFQYLAGWMRHRPHTVEGRAHKVLQRAYQVLYHLDKADELATVAFGQFTAWASSAGTLPENIHGWSPQTAAVIIGLSAAFRAIRILQNEAWMLARDAHGVHASNAPKSMHDAYKGIRPLRDGRQKAWTRSIPLPVRQAISDYWTTSGNRLADHRDVDQHHESLAKGCQLLGQSGTISRLAIWLPDNPEQKAPKQFSYERQTDALALARSDFMAIHDLIETLARLDGAQPKQVDYHVDFVPHVEHRPGIASPTALVLLDVEDTKGLLFAHNEHGNITIRDLPDPKINGQV